MTIGEDLDAELDRLRLRLDTQSGSISAHTSSVEAILSSVQSLRDRLDSHAARLTTLEDGLQNPAGSVPVDENTTEPEPTTAPGTLYETLRSSQLPIEAGFRVLRGATVANGMRHDAPEPLIITDSLIELRDRSFSQAALLYDGGRRHIEIYGSTLRHTFGEPDHGNGVIHTGAGGHDLDMSDVVIEGGADGVQLAGAGHWHNVTIHNLRGTGTYPNNTHCDGVQVYHTRSHGNRPSKLTITGGSTIDLSNIDTPVHANACVFLSGAPEDTLVELDDVRVNAGGAWYSLRAKTGRITYTDRTVLERGGLLGNVEKV